MFVHSRFDPRGTTRRILIGALLAVVLFFNSVGTLLAGTIGTISGTITDQKTGAPLPGVHVSATSPTGQYATKSDGKGFFAFTGVAPDTYTVSFELEGYQPTAQTGINVFADQVANVSITLPKSLITIGRVTARSPGGAFQPNQTQDTYTVTSSQISTQLGKSDAISETSLLVSLPGASLDSSGYPVLRGGRENEEGFQFEGIDYTDAFTSQFINSLALNPAVGQLQLIPGAGDASQGNAGTGVINLVAKRGARPAFGSIDLEALAQPYDHQLGLEYGFATPNNRFSEYVTFLGTRADSQIGPRTTPAIHISTGTFYATSYFASADIVNNTFYHFGRGNNQSIQLFYENQRNDFYGGYGGIQGMSYPVGDAFVNHYLTLDYTFLNSYQLATLTKPLPGEPAFTQLPGCDPNAFYGTPGFSTPCVSAPLDRGPINYYQPNDTLKVQYSNNIDASTFVTLKAYKTNAVVTFDWPFDENSLIEQEFYLKQGGARAGLALDSTKQFNSKNLVQFGGKFEFLHPTYDWYDPMDGVLATSGFSPQYEAADFINPNTGYCPAYILFGGTCGYLWQNFAGGPQWASKGPGAIPVNAEQSVSNRQDASVYLLDKFSPSDKVKIDAGFRVDSANYKLPPLTGCNPSSYQEYFTTDAALCNYAPTGYHKDSSGNEYPFTSLSSDVTHPIVPEPRLALSYQLTHNDAFRASFARSVEFPSLGVVDLMDPVGIYSAFANVPSYSPFSPLSNGAAVSCGIFANGECANYAQQLRWNNQNFIEGVPIQPVKPETFTNWDASFSHQFPANVSVKLTPFYRRGYDQTALVSQPRTLNGVPIIGPDGAIEFGPNQATNLGVSQTSGVEFYLTKEAQYGLSGSFTATYLNEFSNVIPTSPGEDFFPSIPYQSLQLGNLYRVGFLSPFQATLALQYKTRNGIRINPVIAYDIGYPIGAGTIAPFVVNNVAYNVPETNVTSPFGSTGAWAYVDPTNPGSVFHPNIIATRGTPESNSPGGVLSSAHVNTNVSIEYSPPRSHSTFGVYIANLFNQLYSNPAFNARWQPVANGIGGPLTGYSTTYYNFPEIGVDYHYANDRYGYDPYLISPTRTPTTFRLYYQLGL